MAIQQVPLAGMEHLTKREEQPITSMSLLDKALAQPGNIEVIKELAALRREEMARAAELCFNEAMNAVQAELGRIAPDLTNKQTSSKYASYAALDRAVRPAYTRHGFSLSFNTAEVDGDLVKVLCYVSHRDGHTREYRAVMPADGKGAKGGDVMTKTHAAGAAMSYGMRYLLKLIFNLAIGEEDDDGNLSNGWLSERVEWIENCRNVDELKRIFTQAYEEAKAQNNARAMLVLTQAKDKRKAEL